MEQHGATIDHSNRYRYNLWRSIPGGTKGTVLFIMLNPSTADAMANDPTIRRCMGFAERFGHCRLEVVNLYAYRSTDPANLATCDDPVGPENFAYIEMAAAQAELVIAAWGVNALSVPHVNHVTTLVRNHKDVMCLGKTKAGHPRHPLYLPSDAPLQIYRPRFGESVVETIARQERA